jgi:hypothetical protein
MTRRMLDSRRFTNESYASMPIAARHLQDGMINIADDQGRLKANPVYLRNEIFPYDDVQMEQIQVWLNLMVTNETILLYQANGRDYVQFNNWWVYQSLTFARPSDYPPPEGWEDRICLNGKSNIPLTRNWTKVDGTRVKDTCDAMGKPLPFVVEIIAAKKAGTHEVPQIKQIRGESTPEVYTQAYTQAYTSDYTQAYTQVNKQQTEVERQTEVEVEVKNNDDDRLRALAREEGTFVGVVGLDALISGWNDEQVMALLTWCWLYNGYYQEDVIDRQTFRDRYKRVPFKGMNDPVAVMIKLSGQKIMAPLAEKHQDDLIAALSQEPQP